MSTYLIMSHSHVNRVFIASSNRVGKERDETFIGGSFLSGPEGWPIVMASDNEEELLIKAVDLKQTRGAPVLNSYNDLYRDRRTDLYDDVLGYGQNESWTR